jgi:hypothetical protein
MLDFKVSYLKLHTLRKRRHHLGALFLFKFTSLLNCLSLLEAVGLVVCRDFDIFKTKFVSLRHIL